MKKLTLPFLILLCHAMLCAQNAPKREMRAAWITTVSNLDWPLSKTLTPAAQREQLIDILDKHKEAGLNAVLLQIRNNSDAFYPTALAPWADWLTGTQGKAPEPFYDPLAFAIAECRKRGLEFHAWFNPYRAVANINTAVLADSHIVKKHPEWLLAFGNARILDPGIPDVRSHVTRVVMDVVRRYDIDGVHFDDFFYPYPSTGLSFNDDGTFAQHSRNFTDRNNWRRDNVDILIKMVADSVKAAKPWVKFGISPFGIWQNKSSTQPLGSDTRGLESFSAIYCDSRKWVQEGWIDYIAPQLYWYIGFGVADYAILQTWWSQNASNRHIYIGQGAYRVGADANWNAAELPRQLRSNRLAPNIQGSIFFRTGNLNQNTLGFRDSLIQNFYQKPALLPNMTWKPSANLSAPTNVNAISNTDGVRLTWTRPTAGTAELSKSRGYAVYRFLDNTPVDISKAENLLFVVPTDTTVFLDKTANASGRRQYTYVVTTLNRLHDESPASSSAAVIVTNLAESIAQNIDIQSITPNPVTSQGSIFYKIKEAAHVQIELLDATGKTHALLLNAPQTIGEYTTDFDVSALANGIYFIKLTAKSLEKNTPAATLVRKIVVVK